MTSAEVMTVTGSQESTPSARSAPSPRSALYCFSLLLAVGGTYAILTWSHRTPIVYADEAGYLGNARSFVGGPLWKMGHAAFYSFGFSLVIAPVVAFVHSPVMIYHGVILINCLMCGTLAIVLFYTAQAILKVTAPVAAAASLIACAYPAVSAQAGIAWSEVCSMLGFALFVLTAWRLLQNPGPVAVLLHALLAAYLFFVHGRFVVLPILCAALLIYLAVLRPDLRISAVASLIALVAVWGVGEATQRALDRARWGTVAGGSGLSFRGLIQSFPADMSRAVVGQTWYLVVGTGGLALLGFAGLVRGTLSNAESAAPSGQTPVPAKVVLGYILSAVLSVTAVSSVYVATGLIGDRSTRLDYVAYGRYDDAVIPTLLVLGLALILVKLPRRGTAKILAAAAAATIATGLTLEVLEAQHSLSMSISVVRIPAIFGLVAHGARVDSRNAIVIATIAVAVFILILAAISQKLPRVACLCVLAAFTTVGLLDFRAVTPIERQMATAIPLYQHLAAMHPAIVGYDDDYYSVAGYFGLPFWLNDSRFVHFQSSDSDWPRAQLFVGPPQWPAAVSHGLHLLEVDRLSDEGIWVHG